MYDDKKLLFIMRHAKSDRTLTDMVDFDRPLNERGTGEPKIIAKALNKLDVTIEKAVVSPARRTVDTWLLLEKKLNQVPNVIFDKRLYNALYQVAIEVLLEDADDCNSLLMIGHNPSVTELCEFFTGEPHEFKPATCALLSAKDATLAKSLTRPGRFTLEAIFTAK